MLCMIDETAALPKLTMQALPALLQCGSTPCVCAADKQPAWLQVTKNGIVHLAFHPCTDSLVLAAADKSGHIGLWSVDNEAQPPSASASKENQAQGEAEHDNKQSQSGTIFTHVISTLYMHQSQSGILSLCVQVFRAQFLSVTENKDCRWCL